MLRDRQRRALGTHVALDRQKLGFFLLQELVDLGVRAVGVILQVVMRELLLGILDFLFLQSFFVVLDWVG
jgi:hypothetical protein